MAVSLIRRLVLAGSCLLAANAFLIPEENPQTFEQGETIRVNVNSLSSSETQLTYDYYSLPFCKSKDGVKRAASPNNPGTNRSGLRMFNSPYLLRLNEHERVTPVCEGGSAGPLTKQHAQDIKDKIDSHYRVRFVLDNMPITTDDLTQVGGLTNFQTGFELGAVRSKDHVIFNHLAFNVLIHRTHGTHGKHPSAMPATTPSNPPHRRLLRYEDNTASGRALAWPDGTPDAVVDALRVRSAGTGRGLTADDAGSNTPWSSAEQEEDTQWEIVGFEVMPCSIKRTAGEPLERVPCMPWGDKANPEPQVVAEGEDIVYTYDVYWQESEVEWANRWSLYTGNSSAIMRWYSIALLSLLGAVLLCAAVAVIVVLIVRRDAAKYEQLLARVKAAEQRLWSRLDAGVFQAPPTTAYFAVYIATCTHLVCAAAAALAFSAVCLLAPVRRGALLTALPALYLCLTALGNFVSVTLIRSTQHSTPGWEDVCVNAIIWPLSFAVTVYSFEAVVSSVPISDLANPNAVIWPCMLLYWINLGILLSFGLFLGYRSPLLVWPGTVDAGTTKPQPKAPPTTTSLSSAAGRTALSLAIVSLATAAGAPAVHLVMLSFWRGVYFGFTAYIGLFSAAAITVLWVAVGSVLCTYVQLCSRDGRWWWQSFRRGGTPAVPLLAYAGIFRTLFLPDLHSTGLLLYGCYTLSLAIAVYLCLGAVGFAASFAFVYYAHARMGPTAVADADVDASDTNAAAPESQKLLKETTLSM